MALINCPRTLVTGTLKTQKTDGVAITKNREYANDFKRIPNLIIQ